MIDLKAICDEMNEDIEAVVKLCDDLYNQNFSSYFQNEKELFQRLQSKSHPITDDELESILTELPLQLFSVSEKLSKFKITQEVIRMKNKIELSERTKSSKETSQTRKREDAETQLLENKLLDTIYSSIISRVDNEISFSRELIMGAKKIWDRRRQTEGSNPVGLVDSSKLSNNVPKNTTFYEQTKASRGQYIM